MLGSITRAELAEEAGKLGATATSWIYQVTGPREAWNCAAPAETVAAFLAAFRERLDAIEARSGHDTDSPSAR